MKSEGPRLGYQDFADHIEEHEGEFFVSNPEVRQQILQLRNDPQVASDMAAAFTRRNGDYLMGKFGRMPSPGELYYRPFSRAERGRAVFRTGTAKSQRRRCGRLSAPRRRQSFDLLRKWPPPQRAGGL